MSCEAICEICENLYLVKITRYTVVVLEISKFNHIVIVNTIEYVIMFNYMIISSVSTYKDVILEICELRYSSRLSLHLVLFSSLCSSRH